MDLRIGLTQRVEILPTIGERRDCLDQNWFRLLDLENILSVPIPNSLKNPEKFVESLKLDGIIFTGGNDLPTVPNCQNVANERDQTEKRLLEYAIHRRMPILGVCRGMQFFASYFGAKLDFVNGHIKRNHIVTTIHPLKIPLDISESVNSFHQFSLIKESIPSDIITLFESEDGCIEGLCHQIFPILGLMWHPERSHGGKNIGHFIKNFFSNPSHLLNQV